MNESQSAGEERGKVDESQSAESGNENEEGREKEKEKEVVAVDVSASAYLPSLCTVADMRLQTTPHETTSPTSENGEEATEAVNVRIPSCPDLT